MENNNGVLNIDVTNAYIYTNNAFNDPTKRYIIHQGGSRSGKTYNLCIFLMIYALHNNNKIISIVRKTYPALRDTVMRDFFEIVKLAGYYNEESHNKTEKTFTFPTGSMVEFFAIDDDQKVRGRKRDVLFINEANELDNAIFTQLMMRTKGKCIMDFNPSDSENYIYKLLEKSDAELIKTTYLDNPFLEEDQIKFIEDLIHTDENYYKIYALGERPLAVTRVYSHFKTYKETPNNYNDIAYGLDFGYNHPAALVKCYFGDEIYVEEKLYKSNLTSSDLVNEINKLDIDKRHYIYCDFARPEIIEDLRRAGYNVKNADKEVIAGINTVKTSRININEESINLLNEYKKYSWKVNGDRVLDEVVKLYDDLLDALRYCLHSSKKQVRSKPKFYSISI